MNENKRLILALVISIAVIAVFSRIMPRPAPRQQESTEANEKKPVPGAAGLQEKISGMPAEMMKSGAAGKPGDGRKKDIVVETGLYQAVFSPYGAIRHWRLKNYERGGKKGAVPGEFVDIALGTDTQTPDFIYEVSALEGKKGVSMRMENGGIKILKEIVFEEDRYRATMQFTVANNSSLIGDIPLFQWGPGVAEPYDPRGINFSSYTAGKVKRYKAYKIKSTIVEGDVLWSGMDSRYFALAVLPGGPGQSLVIKAKNDGAHLEVLIKDLAPGTTVSGAMTIYAGPKDYEKLKSEGKGLHMLINFGAFGVIGKPIFYMLKWFQKVTGNYGIAIIIIAILIKVALFPLSRRSIRSMQDMQKIQPQVEMLKQRFKNDKEGFAREQMEMFKRNKINPLGGCLPLLLQMPVFFALFVVLQNSIELRHAPFMFWIKDLSSPDPLFVLPVLMGITTFIQQKMTPTTSQQGKSMMYFMPIFLTVVFLKFPSGLVLYWFSNNVLSIIEQWLIRKMA